jgi:hypothetical protein
MAEHDDMMTKGETSDKERDMIVNSILAREANKMQSAISDSEADMMRDKAKMTPEEEIILESLIKSGMSMDTALDIMASNKVDSINKLETLKTMSSEPVRPEEFGGLTQVAGSAIGGATPAMAGAVGKPAMKGTMSDAAMMQYLASKTDQAKGAMGTMLGALSGTMGGATMGASVPPMGQPMNQPMMPPQNKTMMRR